MSSVPAVPFQPAVVPGTDTPPQAVMPKAQEKKTVVKKEIPMTDNKVIGAKITLTFRGEDGNTYESTTTISGEEYKIQKYALDVDEKHEKKRDPETKDLIGFEDTGERVLTFKLRYHVR